MIHRFHVFCDLKILVKRFYSSSKQTYYDILNVHRNSTNKEIRNSFLKLSKKCHPDVKGTNDAKNNEEYLRIMEAYQVLSKKDSRRLYDLSLEEKLYEGVRTSANAYHTAAKETWRVTPDYDSNPGPYYGVKGIPKLSNIRIVGILLILAAIGTIFEFYLVRNSMTFRRDILDEKSREAGLQHANVRADAEKYGNEKQLERIKERFLQRKYGGP